MIIRVTAWRARDDQMIPRLERLSGDALSAELSRSTPFHGVADHGSVLLCHHQLHEGVRIAKKELNQLSFDRLALSLEIRRGKGVKVLDPIGATGFHPCCPAKPGSRIKLTSAGA